MKKTFAALAFLVAAIATPLCHASDPMPVPDLVKTWAKALNKPVVWEAGNDYNGRLVQFEDVDTSEPGVFERAFNSLNAVLGNAGHAALRACMFNNAVVIRRVNQPACGKPL